MARKGPRRSQKARSAERAMWLNRKQRVWTLSFEPGTHGKKSSVPLGFALRELIGVAGNRKEVKHLLQQREVLVDGIARTSDKFPIGLFDIVELPKSREKYRALLDGNGRILLEKEKEKELNKLCRIERKMVGKGGLVQFGTNDGRTFTEKKSGYRVGDSVLSAVPEQKIVRHFALERGNSALVVKGKHVGTLTHILEVIPSTMKRKKTVTLEAMDGGKQFQTTAESVFVVGEKNPAISWRIRGDEE